jgi:DNA mismatch repair protein MutS
MPSQNPTPIRSQYLKIKNDYPDAIVFFRLGDFYETFDEDAEITSRELNIVLTSRNVSKKQRIPMAGIPFHAADTYISKLINKGYHVAICEQIGEQPKKGIFPREVVRVVTPGTVLEQGLLKSERNNFLLSIYKSDSKIGLAYLDISTGDSGVTEFIDDPHLNKTRAEISRINPAEIIFPESFIFKNQNRFHQTPLPDWKFEFKKCEQTIKRVFGISVLDGFGLRDQPELVCALGGLLTYIQDTDPTVSDSIKNPNLYSIEDFMILDQSTRRNLELTKTLRGNEGKGSLLFVLDKTVTPMGKRQIYQWVNQPLKDIEVINKRLDNVDLFIQNGLLRIEIQTHLKKISDIERICNRISSKRAAPKDLTALRSTLEIIPEVFSLLADHLHKINFSNMEIDTCSEELNLLQSSISENPPATLQHIGVIKDGYSKPLDQIIDASKHARDWIANLEKIEKEKFGIKTLKVGYNKIFGYYIEISKSNLEKTPENYIRKQTLVNAERFITPELKEFESIVLNADEEIRKLESQVFDSICEKLSSSQEKFRNLAKLIADVDGFLSLAEVASENNYCRPILSEDTNIEIHDGRHPVVEGSMQTGSFIANNTVMDNEHLIQVITGPNMSGKSTYLRQVALIALMAQIGSYVPATSAWIGLVDRIFTRIGAQDEIHAGQSTFMVEMVETAFILNNATNRSLLVLDEIGRGTSTYDGLSIAWAVIEYIHNHPNLQSRTFFATHYHELTIMPEFLPLVCNYNVAVSESQNDVVFLHKILEGASDKSYGIHVAQLAGMPTFVINRASDLLNQFENEDENSNHLNKIPQSNQLPLFELSNPLLEELDELDANSISPIEALNIIHKWKKRMDE